MTYLTEVKKRAEEALSTIEQNDFTTIKFPWAGHLCKLRQTSITHASVPPASSHTRRFYLISLEERKMDEITKELVAVGASAAANCHPCMDYHLAKCDELGIDRQEVVAAAQVGLMVNRGAENAIRKKARELLGESAIAARP